MPKCTSLVAGPSSCMFGNEQTAMRLLGCLRRRSGRRDCRRLRVLGIVFCSKPLVSGQHHLRWRAGADFKYVVARFVGHLFPVQLANFLRIGATSLYGVARYGRAPQAQSQIPVTLAGQALLVSEF